MFAGEQKEQRLIRSFIAINLPESLIRPLSELRDQLDSLQLPVRWLSPMGMHLTLVFLGDQSPKNIERISGVLKQRTEQSGAFDISFGQAGVFPNHNNPRIIWIGVMAGMDELGALQRELVRDLAVLPGITLEKRPFKAHLTLGRVKTKCDVKPALHMIDNASGNFNHTFPVSAIHLYESVLRPSGADYHIISLCPLGAAQ